MLTTWTREWLMVTTIENAPAKEKADTLEESRNARQVQQPTTAPRYAHLKQLLEESRHEPREE